jgi:hypothetical protein
VKPAGITPPFDRRFKYPYGVDEWQLKATNDPSLIAEMCRSTESSASYGVLTGRGSCLFVLDYESEAQYEDACTAMHFLSDAFTVKTPRGYHIYLWAPTPEQVPRHMTDGDSPVGDLISNTHVVGPYCTRADGGRYEPLDADALPHMCDEDEIRQVCQYYSVGLGQPEQVERTAWDPQDVAGSRAEWDDLVDATDISGLGHDAWWGACRNLFSASDPEWDGDEDGGPLQCLIDKTLDEHGERIPGKTEEMLLRMERTGPDQWATALRLGRQLHGVELTPEQAGTVAADEFEVDPNAVPPEPNKSSTQETERRQDFWMLSELAENPDLLMRGERLTPTGMGRRGELTLIAGLPKQGKSRFCAWEASVCSCEGIKVLWVSFEEALPRLVSRFMECGADLGNVGIAHYPASLERIAELIDEMEAEVIYIDSGASYIGNTLGKIPDNSQSTEWQVIYNAVQRVADEKEVAIIVLVHSPNAQPGEVRGSNGATAAADSIWKMRGSVASRKRTFNVVGRWDNEKLAYESNHDTSPTDYAQVDALVAVSLAARIFQHLVRNPDSTTDAIRKEIRGGNYQTLKRELETLAEGGYIEERRGTGKSHNARFWTAVPGFTISGNGQRIISQSDIGELDTEVAP